MSRRSTELYAQTLLSTARTNPAFALRVARDLPKEAHGAFVSALAKPAATAAAEPRRPGLKKCAPSPFSPSNGFTAQLSLFAKAVASVR